MSTVVVAAAGPSPLWYLTRGTGVVALILLTASVVLGVLNASRWSRPTWPRFATSELHRNVSLLVVAVLSIHIVTAELDTFAPVGWLAVVVPLASRYRPIWLGLGTLAFDLLLALVVTSLFRQRIGHRTWRGVHWLAYASWPVALVHGLGTGTDARVGFVQFLDVICVAAVVATVGWRVTQARPGRRLTLGVASAVAVLAMASWAAGGPLKPGWAKKAGTPSRLLASARASAPIRSSAAPPAAPSPSASTRGSAAIPALPFSASLAGSLTQIGPGSSGDITITITARVSGAMTGTLDVVLRGQPAGGGVYLQNSAVTFGPTDAPTLYRGELVALDGDQLVASVKSVSARPLDLGINLQIDPASGTVQGTLQAQTARHQTAQGGSSENGDGGQ